MAWPLHTHHRHDNDRHRWERPPQVRDGQVAVVHAPQATALLERSSAETERPDRSPDLAS